MLFPGAGLLLHHLDVRVELHVLLDELLVAELVEGGDGQRDLPVGGLGVIATGGHQAEGEHADGAEGEPSAQLPRPAAGPVGRPGE